MEPSTKRWLGAWGACVAVACGAVACAPPTVGVTRAGISKITTTGLRVLLDLSVANPNQYELPVRQVRWNLGLFDAEVTRGATPQRALVVPPNARAPVRVPVGVRYETVGNIYQKLLSSRTIPWSVAGQVDVQTPIGPFYVKFAEAGSWRNPIASGEPQESAPPTMTASVEVGADELAMRPLDEAQEANAGAEHAE
jgi:LEA14-like dessication related protein